MRFASPAITSSTLVLVSMTKSWLISAFSLRNLAIAPSTILATISAGLPLSAAFSDATPRARARARGCGALAPVPRARPRHRPLAPLGADRGRLAALSRLFRRDRALALDQRRIELVAAQ